MNTCSTCKYWGLPPDLAEDIPESDDNKFCSSDKINGKYQNLDTVNSYEAVHTGRNFGCIHYEPKEEQ